MMKMGVEGGKAKLEEAMNSIRELEGEFSYDYACLKANAMRI